MHKPNKMPKKKIERSQEEKERLAARTVASSDGEISIPAAMKIAGINTPSRKNNTIYRRVHRESKRVEKLLAKMEGAGEEVSINSTPKPASVAAKDNSSDFSSLSSATPLMSTPLRGRTLLDDETIGTTGTTGTTVTGSTTTNKWAVSEHPRSFTPVTTNNVVESAVNKGEVQSLHDNAVPAGLQIYSAAPLADKTACSPKSRVSGPLTVNIGA